MNRLAVSVLVVLPALCGVVNAQEQERPNIILILTDDLDARAIDFMPNLQTLLVRHGTSFSNYFVNVSICCPSRASLLRGQFAHSTDVHTNRPPYGGFVKFRDSGLEHSTLATWLQASGYRTALIGRYLNGYPGNQQTYIPEGWDEWYVPLMGKLYFKYQLNENGTIHNYGSNEEDYETDVLAAKAVDFIHRVSAKNEPFFIYLAPRAPHVPAKPAPRHQNVFAGSQIVRGPSFNEADVSDKPLRIRHRRLLDNNDIDEIENRYRTRLETLLAVDDMILAVVKALRKTGDIKNTYIFFTSDNGFHQGEHRIAKGKGTPYDESTRVPLLVRGPNVRPACTTARFAQNTDIAPTIAELAGATLPAFVEGRSLAGILKDHSQSAWQQEALVEQWTREDSRDFEALRTDDYLYIEYGSGELELYDVRTDPYQLESFHAIADPALLQQLSTRIRSLTGKAADSSTNVSDASVSER